MNEEDQKKLEQFRVAGGEIFPPYFKLLRKTYKENQPCPHAQEFMLAGQESSKLVYICQQHENHEIPCKARCNEDQYHIIQLRQENEC